MKQYLPLFDDADDQVSIQPKTTKDDVEFQKERRRARKKPGRTPPAPVTGPCCERCVRWARPVDDDEFGHCRHLGVARDRNPAFGIEKGMVISFEEAKEYGVHIEWLRTGPSFQCRAYQALEEQAA